MQMDDGMVLQEGFHKVGFVRRGVVEDHKKGALRWLFGDDLGAEYDEFLFWPMTSPVLGFSAAHEYRVP